MIDRKALRRDLEKLRGSIQWKYWIVTAMLVAVFVFQFVLAVRFYESPQIVAAVAGGCGLTLATAIATMLGVVRQSARVNLAIILAREVETGQLPHLMKLLLEKLK